MEYLGHNGMTFYFADNSIVVSVDERTNAVSRVSDISSLALTKDDIGPLGTTAELVHAAFTSLDIKVSSTKNRKYTVPKAVQKTASDALSAVGTDICPPIARKTAELLADGGQVDLDQIKQISRYFSHHITDDIRRFGDLWGGSQAEKWVAAIVARESLDISTYATKNTLELSAFTPADGMEEQSHEFFIRLFSDGSGFDRLYLQDLSGGLLVWEDGVWYDTKCFSDYAENYSLVPVDNEAALVASAFLDGRLDGHILLSEFNPEEAALVVNAIGDLDFSEIDAITAASDPSTTPNGYTPDERSANAEKQVRDANGRFAVTGARTRLAGDPSVAGTITSIDPAAKTVTIQGDDGKSYTVPAANTVKDDGLRQTSPVEAPVSEAKALETAGIFSAEKPAATQEKARLNVSPTVLTANDLFTLLSDWPTWVANQRAAVKDVKVPQIDVTPVKDWAKAPNAYNDPLLRKWLDEKKVGKNGKTVYPNRIWYQPLPDAYKTSVDKKKSSSAVYASAAPQAGKEQALNPSSSDVAPVYMALVSPDDPQAVMDLVAMVPKTNKSISPTTFVYRDEKWEQDARILADLKSPTPPPVVVLDGEELASVVEQIKSSAESAKDRAKDAKEQKDAEQSAKQALSMDELLSLMFAMEDRALTAAGGLDQNRGNAEKLRHYWTVGKGGLKIRWGTGGDWTRCVRHLSKYLGPRAKGYCALRHKEMTGLWTGDKTHRQMYGRKNGGVFAMSDEMLLSSEEIIEKAILRAQAEEQKKRVLTASGSVLKMVPAADGAKFIIPLVVPEGVETGDGRKFSAGAITLRELPLPLLWQIKTAEGHNGSVVVGRIDHMERIDGGIGNAYGVFDNGEYGREAERLVRGGFIRGISADLDRFEASEEPIEAASKDKKKIGGGKITINKARVMGVTLVPKPAFQECTIQLAEEPVEMGQSEQDALVACASVVASIPVVPPRNWFNDPKLNAPTPLTVTDEGRVFGHIAAWHVDHIGLSFGTKPPRSRSGYAYFHTGVIRTDDGSDVPVGQLTLAGGHASLSADAAAAAKHYDDTASAFADVHAGEDAYGIWVSGALRPSISPEQVRAIRASAPSGDWRPIQGSLELVAVCQVNVPGFPIARARVASGQVYALVAAGANYLARIKADPTTLQAAENVKARFAAIRSEMENKTITAGISMDKNASEPMTVEVLERLLADVVDFSYRAWGFHWNVTGEDFTQYHDLFGTIQSDVDGSIDPIAENIRKIGGFPHIRLSDYVTESTLPPCDVEGGDARALAAHLLMANEVLIKELNNAFHVFEAVDDQAICNFIADRLDKHHKWSWQLASSISPTEIIVSEDESREHLFDTVFSSLVEEGLVASIDMFATFTEEQRKNLADKGFALPDGSYPIRNVSDLKNAIHAYGRAKPADRAKVRAHIKKRARALGHAELIPATFSIDSIDLSAKVDEMRNRITAITAAAPRDGDVDPKA